MFEMKNISFSIGNKKILKDFNIEIKKGTTHVLMGSNGSGKSTLTNIIMGNENYPYDGEIYFNGEKLDDLDTSKRSKKGIFLSFQNPEEIEGVKVIDFLRTALKEKDLYTFIKEFKKEEQKLNFNQKIESKELNVGFSGGEKKKLELLQLKMLKPKFIILDEIDSGLDIESIKIVCQELNSYIKENKDVMLLIITHYPKMLEYLKVDYVHKLKNGKIVETGDKSLITKIEKEGF